MCAAFLDRPNEPSLQPPVVLMRQLGRSKNATYILCSMFSPFMTTRGGSRRCGDDCHPGEEIYVPSGDAASRRPGQGIKLPKFRAMS